LLAKISKIARFILLLLLFSLGLLYIIFKSRPVQTWLVQKATFYLSGELGTKVRVGGVDIEFFKTLSLEHVYIEDLHHDTLFYIRNLKADYHTFDNVKRVITLNSLTVEGAKVLFGVHPGESTGNFEFFIEYFQGGPRDPNKPKVVWTVHGKEVYLINARFDYFNRNDSAPDFMPFNYNDMSYRNINASLNDFYLVDDSINFHSSHLSFNEKCGLKVTEFISDAKIHEGGLEFEKLIFQTANQSDIRERIILQSNSWTDYADFNHKVFMKADLKGAIIDSRDLAFFSNHLKSYETIIRTSGYAEGYVSDMHGKKSKFKLFDNTVFEGDWSLQGLPNIDNTLMIFELDNFQTDYNDLNKISMGNIPANLSKLGKITYKGSFSGYYNDFVTFGKIKTALGDFNSDMNLKFKDGFENATYSGKLKTDLFKLQTFLPDAQFDDAAFDLKIKGAGIDAKKYSIEVEGDINQIAFNNYNYHQIKIKGIISKKLFSGIANIRDPHLNLDFEGEVNSALAVPEASFNLKLMNADLAALGFDKHEQNIKGTFDLNFKGKNVDEAIGSITGKNISIYRNNTLVEIPNLSFSANHIQQGPSKTGEKKLMLQSDIIDINIVGKYTFSKIDVSIMHMFHQLIPVYFSKPEESLPNEDFKFEIDLKEPDKLTSLYIPELSLSPSKATGFYRSSDQEITFNSSIAKLRYKDYYINNLVLNAGKERDSLLRFDASADGFTDTRTLKAVNIEILSKVSTNVIEFKLSGIDTGFDISLNSEGRVIFSEDSIKFVIADANIRMDEEHWILNEDASIIFSDKRLELANVVLRNKKQSMILSGAFGETSINSLNLQIDEFALNTINLIMRDKKLPQLNGISKGNIIYSVSGNKPVISSNLKIINLSIEKDTIGDLTVLTTSKENSALQDVDILFLIDNWHH
jgi:hypothetical protein